MTRIHPKIFDYVVSDTHFGHLNMQRVEPSRTTFTQMRGYSSFDEMIVQEWNDTVGEDEYILHLGDVVFKNVHKLTKRLNGNITLLVGNHDREEHITYYRGIGWKIIDSICLEIEKPLVFMTKLKSKFSKEVLSHRYVACLVVDIEGERVMFSHFPVFDDNKYDKKYADITQVLEYLYIETGCSCNIHGHTHSKPAKESFCKSACLELTDYKIMKLSYFLDDFKKRT